MRAKVLGTGKRVGNETVMPAKQQVLYKKGCRMPTKTQMGEITKVIQEATRPMHPIGCRQEIRVLGKEHQFFPLLPLPRPLQKRPILIAKLAILFGSFGEFKSEPFNTQALSGVHQTS